MGMNSIHPACLLLALITALGTSTVSCVASIWDFSMKDYTNHVCNRPCLNYTTPKLCRYDFLVENYYAMSKACYNCPSNKTDCLLYQCVTAGGVNRVITTANRLLPGPSIEACEGDTIQVKVTNMLDGAEGTTIHWHGILQENSQHMDGVGMVTQCPILMGSHFTYRFTAKDVGTYFWHGHAGTQRADGLFGALIVRQAPDREPHFGLYDFDMSEHVIIVNDWLTVVSVDRLAELIHIRENLHMTVLINGKGEYQSLVNTTTNTTYYTPRAVFTVSPGMRYRFRVINSGILNCPLELSIDNHTLMIIATDGNPVKPVTRDSFTIFAGERYDFVLTANNTSTPRNYWFRVRGLNSCTTYNITQAAILKYQGSNGSLPAEPLVWENDNASNYPDDIPVVEQLVSLWTDNNITMGKPDKKIFLDVDMVDIQNLRAYNPPYYTVESSALFQSPQINYITSMLPPAPPLTQLKDLPEEIFCNADTVQQNCQEEWCVCVHRHQVAVGDLVELILLDDDAYHAMHLHGYKFYVVGWGKLRDGTPLEELKAMDYRGELNRTGNTLLKDTFAAPVGGYYIIRFIANNPGFWLFHCHLEFHMETGMHMIFQVGNVTQLPRRPKNFPVCGSWDFNGYEDTSSTENDGQSCYNSGYSCNTGCNGCNSTVTCNCSYSNRGAGTGHVKTASDILVTLSLIIASLLYFRRSL